MSSAGELRRIWSKRMRRGPMDPRDAASLAPGGLEGDANFGRRFRQVTLIQEELWREVEAELGSALDPALRRANLLVAGVELANSRGRVLQIGPCRLRIQGETRPCNLMDEQYPGLQAALRAPWRGGAFAEVLHAGVVRTGDPVSWCEEGAEEAQAEA